MHLARKLPIEHRLHWACGIQLQQQAVEGAQKAMANITSHNCTAVYLFSALTCVLSLARGCDDWRSIAANDDQSPGKNCESFLEWVVLYRGTRLLLSPPYEEVLLSGPLRPMFELGLQRRERVLAPLATMDTAKSGPLLKLQAAIYNHVKDTDRLEAYDTAIDHLRRAFHAVYDKPMEDLENMDVFAWMFSIPDAYVALLKQQDPIALALFACFASLIQEMRRMWWTHGWGEWCVSQICSKLKEAAVWLVQHVIDVTS
ncbi:C6 zinc finger protein [Colletotrichum higginsianum IMI 349063]|uniref:C6 zinc finger protein n=1 Tax=Colletotrichum higginsianum (strain IMI 349063) TaxID=759273 RepID=A0A1B7YFZ5_COLHI|nr:C6 zinc finger protein [Colletotrichum higginsianum IMI 349063]OBR10902.1 C6 zinc finger protein [Colletotrichum higginsianum IMI 349063]